MSLRVILMQKCRLFSFRMGSVFKLYNNMRKPAFRQFEKQRDVKVNQWKFIFQCRQLKGFS